MSVPLFFFLSPSVCNSGQQTFCKEPDSKYLGFVDYMVSVSINSATVAQKQS